MDTMRQKMAALTPYARKHKVTVIGSGNWGSTIAKLVAENTAEHPELFEKDVQMWVYEEDVEIKKDSKLYSESSDLCKGPQKLTKIINEMHENVKYLPDIPLPTNLVANPDVKDAVKDSTILIFNMPHQFIAKQCSLIKGCILPFARGISCIKGVNVEETSVSLFSETIGKELGIYCGALSGANIANEVAQEKFSETTVAYDPPLMDSQNPTPATSRGPSPATSHVDLTKIAHKDVHGKPSKIRLTAIPAEYAPIDQGTMKKLFHRRYFHVRVVGDVAGVSLGGALKNVVALAAGWVDGLGWGDNAKAAIMRVGLLEMLDFGKKFFTKTVHTATFTEESAGVADLITTCNGGRHLRCAKKSILEGKSIQEIEDRDLNGQKLQGTLTAYEVNSFLKTQGLEKEFPLFTAVYNILEGKAKAQDLPDLIEPHVDDQRAPLHPQSNGTPETPLQPSSTGKVTTPKTDSPRTTSLLIPAPPLARSRYNRQLLLPQLSLPGQHRLLASSILIIGLGGLGCPAALYLAGAGISRLGLVDADTVETSNLHRQILHTETAAKKGMSKVASAIHACKERNSEVEYITHEERLSTHNALGILGEYDIVLDCTDNPATRYLVSDACGVLGKTLVSGAAQRTEGQLMVLNYPARSKASSKPVESGEREKGREQEMEMNVLERGPCYRCVFPRPPDPEMVRGCNEIGILGPVVGCIGTLMASEAIRLIVRGAHLGVVDETRKPSMLLYNAWPADAKNMFRTVVMGGRRKGCVACGEEEVLGKLGKRKITREVFEEGGVDYETWCGRVQDVRVLKENERMKAAEFLTRMESKEGRVIDVREENEFALGTKVKYGINVPLSRILRDPSEAFDGLYDEAEGEGSRSVYFVCHQGNDSQIAARKLMELDEKEGRRRGWVGDVNGGFLALEKVQLDSSYI